MVYTVISTPSGVLKITSGGFADPVALHFLDTFGPVEIIKIIEQSFGVFGDLEHPLFHGTAFDRVVAAFTASVDDLLVCQNGSECRTPVHRDFSQICKTFLVKLHKDPLRPCVVVAVGCIDFAVPVVAESQSFDLAAELVDVFLSGDLRVSSGIDGVLFGGQTESIPAHGVQDVETLHPFVAACDIGRGVSFGVTDMKSGTGGIGEHVQTVILGLIGKIFRFECFV